MIGLMIPSALAGGPQESVMGKSIVEEIDCENIGKEINPDIDCLIVLAGWLPAHFPTTYDEVNNIFYYGWTFDEVVVGEGAGEKTKSKTYNYFGVDMDTYQVIVEESCDIVYTGTYVIESTIPCKPKVDYFNDQTMGQINHGICDQFGTDDVRKNECRNSTSEYYSDELIYVKHGNDAWNGNYNNDWIFDYDGNLLFHPIDELTKYHDKFVHHKEFVIAPNADQNYLYYVIQSGGGGGSGYLNIKATLHVLPEEDFSAELLNQYWEVTTDFYSFYGMKGSEENGLYWGIPQGLFYDRESNKLYYFFKTHGERLLYVLNGKGEISNNVNSQEVSPQESTEPSYSYEPTHVSNFPDPTKSPEHYLDRYNNEDAYREWFDSQFPNRTIYHVLGLPEPATPELEPIIQKIPDWVKNIFTWYSQDQISEDEVLNAIKFLVNQGIIDLDN